MEKEGLKDSGKWVGESKYIYVEIEGLKRIVVPKPGPWDISVTKAVKGMEF